MGRERILRTGSAAPVCSRLADRTACTRRSLKAVVRILLQIHNFPMDVGCLISNAFLARRYLHERGTDIFLAGGERDFDMITRDNQSENKASCLSRYFASSVSLRARRETWDTVDASGCLRRREATGDRKGFWMSRKALD